MSAWPESEDARFKSPPLTPRCCGRRLPPARSSPLAPFSSRSSPRNPFTAPDTPSRVGPSGLLWLPADGSLPSSSARYACRPPPHPLGLVLTASPLRVQAIPFFNDLLSLISSLFDSVSRDHLLAISMLFPICGSTFLNSSHGTSRLLICHHSSPCSGSATSSGLSREC